MVCDAVTRISFFQVHLFLSIDNHKITDLNRNSLGLLSHWVSPYDNHLLCTLSPTNLLPTVRYLRFLCVCSSSVEIIMLFSSWSKDSFYPSSRSSETMELSPHLNDIRVRSLNMSVSWYLVIPIVKVFDDWNDQVPGQLQSGRHLWLKDAFLTELSFEMYGIGISKRHPSIWWTWASDEGTLTVVLSDSLTRHICVDFDNTINLSSLIVTLASWICVFLQD